MHFVDWSVERAQELIASELKRARAFLGETGADQTAMLPILHALQHAFGFIHHEALALVATALNVSKAEVKGVVSFYRDFRTKPPGEHVVSLCRAEACQARGSEALAKHLDERHGLRDGVTAKGVTMLDAYCLGNCSLAPTALVDDEKLVGALDDEKADQLITSLQEPRS
jgi:formate dehydrogenase subunit gamma